MYLKLRVSPSSQRNRIASNSSERVTPPFPSLPVLPVAGFSRLQKVPLPAKSVPTPTPQMKIAAASSGGCNYKRLIYIINYMYYKYKRLNYITDCFEMII